MTVRGKTAQTGRGIDISAALPEIKYDRSISNNRNGFKMVNNLFTHAKDSASNRYGNLLTEKGIGQTIDLLKKPDPSDDIIKNKNFAGIRVNKLHHKKIPDKFSKTMRATSSEDVESMPSDISADQWAEINKYDYELFQEELKRKKAEDL